MFVVVYLLVATFRITHVLCCLFILSLITYAVYDLSVISLICYTPPRVILLTCHMVHVLYRLRVMSPITFSSSCIVSSRIVSPHVISPSYSLCIIPPHTVSLSYHINTCFIIMLYTVTHYIAHSFLLLIKLLK